MRGQKIGTLVSGCCGGLRLALDLGAGLAEEKHEILQRRGFAAAESERFGQQFVDRLRRLRPQPLQQPGAAAERAEGFGQQGVRRDEIGTAAQGGKKCMGNSPVGPLLMTGGQSGEKRAGASDRKRHQAGILEAAQGRDQELREGQVILRQ